MTYPHAAIHHFREDNDVTWAEVVDHFDLDCTPKQLRQAHWKWMKENEHVPEAERTGRPAPSSMYVGLPEMVRNLEDLIRVLDIDEEVWEVVGFPVKTYPIQQKGGRILQGATISANLKPTQAPRFEAEREAAELALEAFRNHNPYGNMERRIGWPPAPKDSPCSAFVNVYDSHLGMLAQGKETGSGDYDLTIAATDYVRSGIHQIDVARIHPIREINIVIGHDLVHIDMINQKVGTTAAGTPQDFDSRIPKIFSTAREVSVEVIDYALALGLPVNVWVVPGNHDPQTVYKLGEVLYAWYRNVDQVTVHYSPNRHRWHLFGKNSILMTHGERSQTKRRSLPMTALAEQPDEHRLALTSHLEILSGHLHTEKRGEYVPAGIVDAERQVTVRNLRGLTEIDSWHELQDYRHVRGSDLLIFHEGGGVVAQHTYFPHIHGDTP